MGRWGLCKTPYTPGCCKLGGKLVAAPRAAALLRRDYSSCRYCGRYFHILAELNSAIRSAAFRLAMCFDAWNPDLTCQVQAAVTAAEERHVYHHPAPIQQVTLSEDESE